MSGGEKSENEEDVKTKPTKGEKRRGRSPSKREPIADIEDIMFSIDKVQTMRSSLLDWFDLSHRDLPWRRLDKGQPETRGYGVWVSEIMLQQTRVQTVVEYYKRWMHRWPTVQHLSRASLEEVNEMWAGLGYYRRARFLLEGAKLIVEEGGEFPKTVSALRKIPGIGEKAAAQLVDPSRPGDFNQALMELGATLCTPTSPSCSTCPVFDHCEALSISKDDSSVLVTDYPAKGIKTKQRHDYSAVCVVEILENQSTSELKQSSRFLLVKRPDEGLLAGLWEFPSVLLNGEADSSTRRESINSLLSKSFGLEPKKNFEIVIREDVGDFVHVFSHIRLKIYVEHLVIRLKGLSYFSFLAYLCIEYAMNSEKKSISWKCVDKKVMSSMGLTSSVRKVYAMVEKFEAEKISPSPAVATKKQRPTSTNLSCRSC
ncbi:Adenine DNA glycosylase [Cucurbita argyrosperma subsp. argyrosperma]|nr:Adenine DNA glycosylase [Cucurbita argyrosperma subsp. argyrosperma]